jgi:ribosomal protein S17
MNTWFHFHKFVWFLVAVVVLSSCTTTRYIPVIEHATDTLVQRVVERDSIHVHDSIRVTEKGDTVTIERWHTQYRDRWHHDSVYIARHDTIPQPYPVTEYVERKRTTFEWVLLAFGVLFIIASLLFIIHKIKKVFNF